MSSMAWNPQLSPVHQGTWSDQQYLADEASLRAEIIGQYHDVLDQLGFTDTGGRYVPGQVEVGAARTQAQLQDAMEAAATGVTNASQREGTLFSGRRGDRQALAERPYRTGLTNLATDTPIALGKLRTRASEILGSYGTRVAPFAAGAIARWTPPDAGGGGGGGATVGDPGAYNPGGTFVRNADGSVTYTGTAGVAGQAPNTQYGQATLFPGSPTFAPPTGTGYVNPNDPDYRQTHAQPMAEGGLVDQPTEALIGEQGPEAVVPLDEGLNSAMQRLMAMYEAKRRRDQQQQMLMGGGQGFDNPRSQGGQPMQGTNAGGQGQQRRANVHAAGLKAAAKIMTELAKHHEEEDGDIQLAPQPRRGPMPPTRQGPRRVPPIRFPELGQASRHLDNLGTLV